MSEFTGFGIVAREPEMKKNGASKYCEIAVSIDKPNSSTLWIQVTVFGTAGKRAYEQARKGYEIYIAGSLILKNGYFYLRADQIKLINASQDVAVKSADLPERQKEERKPDLKTKDGIKVTRMSLF